MCKILIRVDGKIKCEIINLLVHKVGHCKTEKVDNEEEERRKVTKA